MRVTLTEACAKALQQIQESERNLQDLIGFNEAVCILMQDDDISFYEMASAFKEDLTDYPNLYEGNLPKPIGFKTVSKHDDIYEFVFFKSEINALRNYWNWADTDANDLRRMKKFIELSRPKISEEFAKTLALELNKDIPKVEKTLTTVVKNV
jgi:hypothetical protein